MFQADSAEITVIVENWVDMLLPDLHPGAGSAHRVTRTGLVEHFSPGLTPPRAENGISVLVRAARGGHTSTVLFDTGLTGAVLLHNLRALGVHPGSVDHVVISHGHPDHFGGVHALLEAAGRPLPVATHADAFLPRYAVLGDGRVSPFYNQRFTPGSVEASGGRLALTSGALDLGCGIRTTGTVPRDNAFEGPRPPAGPGAPGLYQVRADGSLVPDEVWDEQGLVVDVAGEGLVVLTGCAHAGVLNTVRRARAVCGADRPVRAVMGGFHLGFPTTPEDHVGRTVEGLAELGAALVMPMHCSGLPAHTAFSTRAPDRYVQPAVGTRLHFPA